MIRCKTGPKRKNMEDAVNILQKNKEKSETPKSCRTGRRVSVPGTMEMGLSLDETTADAVKGAGAHPLDGGRS